MFCLLNYSFIGLCKSYFNNNALKLFKRWFLDKMFAFLKDYLYYILWQSCNNFFLQFLLNLPCRKNCPDEIRTDHNNKLKYNSYYFISTKIYKSLAKYAIQLQSVYLVKKYKFYLYWMINIKMFIYAVEEYSLTRTCPYAVKQYILNTFTYT